MASPSFTCRRRAAARPDWTRLALLQSARLFRSVHAVTSMHSSSDAHANHICYGVCKAFCNTGLSSFLWRSTHCPVHRAAAIDRGWRIDLLPSAQSPAHRSRTTTPLHAAPLHSAHITLSLHTSISSRFCLALRAVGAMELLFATYPSGTMRFFRSVGHSALALGRSGSALQLWSLTPRAVAALLCFCRLVSSMIVSRKVIAFSFASGLLVQVPMAVVLWQTWQTPRFCARVLRGYHLMRLAMFLAQIPLRLAVLRSLHHAQSAPPVAGREEVVNRLLRMVRARWWKLNQASGVFAYLLFAFALVFSVAGRHCGDSASPLAAAAGSAPGSEPFSPSLSPSSDPNDDAAAGAAKLYVGLLVTLGAFVLHMLLSLIWVRQIVTEDHYEAAMWRRGVDQAEIDRLTKLVRVDPPSSGADGEARSPSAPIYAGGHRLNSSECAICFCGYVTHQSVRILPCAHHLCQECADSWLQRKKSCPLCSMDIDSSQACSSSFSRAARAQWQAFEAQAQAPCAGDAANNIVVRTVLTDTRTSAASATRGPLATAATVAPSANSSASASSSPRPSSTSPSPEELLAALRSGRRGQPAATYTTAGTIETPVARPSSSTASAAAAAGLSQSEADALAAIEGSMSAMAHRTVVKQVQRAPAAADAPQPSPSARAAPTIPSTRLPYAAARLASAGGGSAWRDQLDEWAEEEDDGDELVKPASHDDFFAAPTASPPSTAAAPDDEATNAPAAAAPTTARTRPTAPPAPASQIPVDSTAERLFKQWQLEEQEANAQGADDSASEAAASGSDAEEESKS